MIIFMVEGRIVLPQCDIVLIRTGRSYPHEQSAKNLYKLLVLTQPSVTGLVIPKYSGVRYIHIEQTSYYDTFSKYSLWWGPLDFRAIDLVYLRCLPETHAICWYRGASHSHPSASQAKVPLWLSRFSSAKNQHCLLEVVT